MNWWEEDDLQKFLWDAHKLITLILEYHFKLLSFPVPAYFLKQLNYYSIIKTSHFKEDIMTVIGTLLFNKPDQELLDAGEDALYYQLMNQYDHRLFLKFCAFCGHMAVKKFRERTVDATYSFSEKGFRILKSNFEKGKVNEHFWKDLEKEARNILKETT